jgi:hypothetical protein
MEKRIPTVLKKSEADRDYSLVTHWYRPFRHDFRSGIPRPWQWYSGTQSLTVLNRFYTLNLSLGYGIGYLSSAAAVFTANFS